MPTCLEAALVNNRPEQVLYILIVNLDATNVDIDLTDLRSAFGCVLYHGLIFFLLSPHNKLETVSV